MYFFDLGQCCTKFVIPRIDFISAFTPSFSLMDRHRHTSIKSIFRNTELRFRQHWFRLL